jgi:aminomethyltransferase
MTDETLKRTALYEEHVSAGAKIVPFAGYEMPVQYTGVIDEHTTVRNHVGLFDVSHMGEVEFTGPRALETVNRIITNDLERIEDGQALYTVMCKPEGGIIDDLVVYRFGPERIIICVNAANRAKDFAWMKAQAGDDCEVTDRSDDYAQIAVQGPRAVELVSRLTEDDVASVGTYRFITGEVAGVESIISRTGYTGEDGFELYTPASEGPAVWRALLDKGADLSVKPAGLGARDSLRLEMRYALYGNDIDETTHPYEAGLGWVVKLDKQAFVSKDALVKIKADGWTRKMVGFEMVGRGIARHGYEVVDGEEVIGTVTSGTKGPSVNKAVGIAYVTKDRAKVGSRIDVRIRGRSVEAKVVKTPFYRKPKAGE